MAADALARENALLKARLAEVEAALAEVQEANRRLEDILRTSQREQFGKRSEKLSPDQFNLALEDAELAQGVLEAAQEKAEASTQLFEFTRVVARHFSPEERIELVEMLCEVMYADGALHDLEASLLRRIGELVYVSDRDRGAARQRVMKRLGIA